MNWLRLAEGFPKRMLILGQMRLDRVPPELEESIGTTITNCLLQDATFIRQNYDNEDTRDTVIEAAMSATFQLANLLAWYRKLGLLDEDQFKDRFKEFVSRE